METILGKESQTAQGTVQNQTITPEPQAAGKDSGTVQNLAPALSFDKMIGSDGAMQEGWRTLLPEDIRNEPCLNNIKHIGAMAKSYVNAQKAVGANKIALPGKNATEAEMNAFFTALGRPETAEKYEFKTDGMPEGVTLDDSMLKAFKDEAFKLGLNGNQAQALVAYQANMVAAQAKAQSQAQEQEFSATMEKLQKEYGDKSSDVIQQCNKAMDTFGLKPVFAQKGLLNNYDVIKALANIGEKISESSLKGVDSTSVRSDVQTRIDQLRGDLKGPLYDRSHPNHAQAVKEMSNLVAQLEQASRK